MVFVLSIFPAAALIMLYGSNNKIFGKACSITTNVLGITKLSHRYIYLSKLKTQCFAFYFQICSYFVDPANCLGPVSARPAAGRDFTAGEKRIASHPDYIHY